MHVQFHKQSCDTDEFIGSLEASLCSQPVTLSHVDVGSLITDGDGGCMHTYVHAGAWVCNLRLDEVGGSDKGPGILKSRSQYYSVLSPSQNQAFASKMC